MWMPFSWWMRKDFRDLSNQHNSDSLGWSTCHGVPKLKKKGMFPSQECTAFRLRIVLSKCIPKSKSTVPRALRCKDLHQGYDVLLFSFLF